MRVYQTTMDLTIFLSLKKRHILAIILQSSTKMLEYGKVKYQLIIYSSQRLSYKDLFLSLNNLPSFSLDLIRSSRDFSTSYFAFAYKLFIHHKNMAILFLQGGKPALMNKTFCKLTIQQPQVSRSGVEGQSLTSLV